MITQLPPSNARTEHWYLLIEKALNNLPITVAELPSGAPAGLRSMVTDANATTFASVVAGGGANNVPVYSDGTNWRIG